MTPFAAYSVFFVKLLHLETTNEHDRQNLFLLNERALTYTSIFFNLLIDFKCFYLEFLFNVAGDTLGSLLCTYLKRMHNVSVKFCLNRL